MRLINTRTGDLEEFFNSSIPRYAILSHTWGEDEVTFKEYKKAFWRWRKNDYGKIRNACHLAASNDWRYIWIDTCCIDKRSSAELQEAINSMYRYYEEAAVCYVYLVDVSYDIEGDEDNPLDRNEDETKKKKLRRSFQRSRWFTRGWTLQELLAPKGEVEFYSKEWNYIGDKVSLGEEISQATRIDPWVLSRAERIHSVSVAERMSWAADRNTSRLEDRAYSLLGLFNVHMPLIYGEGQQAFIRLQEEIIRISADHSIFAWGCLGSTAPDGSLLAVSPKNFRDCSGIVQWGRPKAFHMTNRGLSISLRTIHMMEENSQTFALLNCRYKNDLSGTLALRLGKYTENKDYHAVRGRMSLRSNTVRSTNYTGQHLIRLVYVPEQEIASRGLWQDLQITRHIEIEKSRMKFWLPQSLGQFKIVEVHSPKLWDVKDGTMHVDNEEQVRGGAIIRTDEGYILNIAFGFDRVHVPHGNQGDDERTHSKARDYLLGVWASKSTRKDLLEEERLDASMSRKKRFKRRDWNEDDDPDCAYPEYATLESRTSDRDLLRLIERSRSTCGHDKSACKQGRCRFMHQSTTIRVAELAQLDMTIHTAEEKLGDTVFVLKVELRKVAELEGHRRSRTTTTGRVLIQPPQHTLAESERSIGSMSPEGLVEVETGFRSHELVTTSVVPLLHHELYAEELAAPIQVWIRTPETLRFEDDPRSNLRCLSQGVVFTCFETLDDVAWGFLPLSGPGGLRVLAMLWFVGSSHDDWTVSLSAANRHEAEDELAAFSEACESVAARLSRRKSTESSKPTLPAAKSTTLWLRSDSMHIWAKMQSTRTVEGFAVVIDLQTEVPAPETEGLYSAGPSGLAPSVPKDQSMDELQSADASVFVIEDSESDFDETETETSSLLPSSTPASSLRIEDQEDLDEGNGLAHSNEFSIDERAVLLEREGHPIE